jgi:NADPH:quinone reductase-like Zn-dependent oxidoreductase
MKAIVIHQYGGPEQMKFEDYPDPVAGAGEVLVRVVATSVNPIDYKRRSGMAKDFAPVKFPGIVGSDVSGTVVKLGPGVSAFSAGDRVFGMATRTYAEWCAVPAANLAKVPEGIDPAEAAALPLVTTTGNQLISVGTGVAAGQTVLVAGAAGGVGRSAVFAARERGARVIAGVLKRQLKDAGSLGAERVVATDDGDALAALPPLDAVADAVGGKTAALLLGKVKSGGVFASVLGPPANAKDHPSVRIVPVYAKPDSNVLLFMAQAVRDGKLVIPVSLRLPLREAGAAQAAAEKGGIGKVLLLA